MNKKLRNILVAGSLTTLTACGGGGGGAPEAINDFIQDDLSSLTGSESIISSYSSLLSGFNSTISTGNFASLSSVITDPNEQDISKANDLLGMLNQAETLWSQTQTLIESQDADTKLSIYNSDDYKNAHTALLYLKNQVKPIIQKVSVGQEAEMPEGPFKGSLIKIASMPKKDRVNILIYILGSKRKISVALNEIKI